MYIHNDVYCAFRQAWKVSWSIALSRREQSGLVEDFSYIITRTGIESYVWKRQDFTA